MKKILFISAFLISSLLTFAQINYGAQVGCNVSHLKISSTYERLQNEKYASTVGFVLGVVMEANLKSNWAFRPELNYIQKGYKKKNNNNNLYATNSLYYIEIPMNFTYNAPTSLGTLFMGAGPSIGYGVYGVIKNSGSTNYASFDGKNEANHFNRFDCGMDLIAGFKFKSGSFFSVGYSNGLSDINTNLSDNTTNKNNCISVKLGYMFKNK